MHSLQKLFFFIVILCPLFLGNSCPKDDLMDTSVNTPIFIDGLAVFSDGLPVNEDYDLKLEVKVRGTADFAGERCAVDNANFLSHLDFTVTQDYDGEFEDLLVFGDLNDSLEVFGYNGCEDFGKFHTLHDIESIKVLAEITKTYSTCKDECEDNVAPNCYDQCRAFSKSAGPVTIRPNMEAERVTDNLLIYDAEKGRFEVNMVIEFPAEESMEGE